MIKESKKLDIDATNNRIIKNIIKNEKGLPVFFNM